MKTWKYVLMYLLLGELILSWCGLYIIPVKTIYQDRMKYELVKNNTRQIDFLLQKIALQIEEQDLHDYIIILGDSVAYSGPGPAEQSIGAELARNLQRDGNETAVFNLAMPAMQAGDLYTMLLKLDEHGISTDKVIINVIYAGFAERAPDPAIVFWLQRDLARLDPASYQHVLPNLKANGVAVEPAPAAELNRFITGHLALFRYKDLIQTAILPQDLARPFEIPPDTRPWYEKPGLKKALQTPAYEHGFSGKPFDMSAQNLQIYFLDKIIEHQQGRQPLFFMAAVNPEIFPSIEEPGYQENLQRVQAYFAEKQAAYIDFHGRINQQWFSDHIHLTSRGYAIMARRLAEVYIRE